ncbi:hypothetical protein J4205_01770 [Candidatus Pacearchaeota archaeon]|nr:hypothetical protein [uncultured archaeon]MBS3066528.1 hypothetical protein [Candidatus Pacearchaeota archaeon]
MVDKDLLNKLDSEGIIDKRHVLWWQLGFEGRRVLTEEEFNSGLQEVDHECYLKDNPESKGVEKVNIWKEKYAPIFIKNTNLDGIQIPSFVSVRPLLDYRGLESPLVSSFPLQLYYSPHIRGVVVEKTNDFLFWNPFIVYENLNCWRTYAIKPEGESLPIMLQPIAPHRFYKNLSRCLRTGKRAQKKYKKINCKSKDSERVVPYYEFDALSRNFTVYPANVFQDRLDLPVILQGNPDTGIPKIIGSGTIYFDDEMESEQICYLELNDRELKSAKLSLIRRLGSIRKKI